MKIDNIEMIHRKAHEYLILNQEKLLKIILNSLMVQYAVMRKNYGYDEEELEEYMPRVDNIDDFKKTIKLKRIYILNVEKEGMAYIGFHFWCKWDEEHGLGVMVHKERIIKMGGADSSFLSWIADEDSKSNID